MLQPKFDTAAWLRLAEQHRVTHAMRVPVKDQHLLARPEFGATDLSRFRYKFCTSAPFSAALKAEATREAEWFAPYGQRFLRTGGIGRFDAKGFPVPLGRRKDVVISGGFNVYPSDLEAVLREHPQVAYAAVVGVPFAQWGETPVAFVARHVGAAASASRDNGIDELTEGSLLAWANARLGRTQRLQAVRFIDELPRSAIGKVLERELRELAAAPPTRP